jgi:hypothetical protein
MTHSAIVGGSTAARVLACPPSRLIPKPPEVASRYAQEGSALHSVIEATLGSGRDVQDFAGVHIDDIEIVDEMLDEKVSPAMEAFNQYADQYMFEDVVYEAELKLSPIPGAFGTADVLALSQDGTVMHVVDWKFGSGNQVEAIGNKQLLFYAAAALFTRPDATSKVATARLVVIQPNDRGMDTLREWEVSRFDLIEFASALRWAVNHPDVPRVSGDHCRYCPGRVTCPRLRDDAKALTVWANPHPEVTPDQVSDMLEMAETTEMQIDALRAHAHAMAEAGQPPTGWKLVPRRALRKWVDAHAAVSALIAANPNASALDVIDPPTLKSPAQIEKLKLVIPDGLTEARSTGTTLVRTADPRREKIATDPLKRLAQSTKRKL